MGKPRKPRRDEPRAVIREAIWAAVLTVLGGVACAHYLAPHMIEELGSHMGWVKIAGWAFYGVILSYLWINWAIDFRAMLGKAPIDPRNIPKGMRLYTVTPNDHNCAILALRILGDHNRWWEIIAPNIGRRQIGGGVFRRPDQHLKAGWVLLVPASSIDSVRRQREQAAHERWVDELLRLGLITDRDQMPGPHAGPSAWKEPQVLQAIVRRHMLRIGYGLRHELQAAPETIVTLPPQTDIIPPSPIALPAVPIEASIEILPTAKSRGIPDELDDPILPQTRQVHKNYVGATPQESLDPRLKSSACGSAFGQDSIVVDDTNSKPAETPLEVSAESPIIEIAPEITPSDLSSLKDVEVDEVIELAELELESSINLLPTRQTDILPSLDELDEPPITLEFLAEIGQLQFDSLDESLEQKVMSYGATGLQKAANASGDILDVVYDPRLRALARCLANANLASESFVAAYVSPDLTYCVISSGVKAPSGFMVGNALRKMISELPFGKMKGVSIWVLDEQEVGSGDEQVFTLEVPTAIPVGFVGDGAIFVGLDYLAAKGSDTVCFAGNDANNIVDTACLVLGDLSYPFSAAKAFGCDASGLAIHLESDRHLKLVQGTKQVFRSPNGHIKALGISTTWARHNQDGDVYVQLFGPMRVDCPGPQPGGKARELLAYILVRGGFASKESARSALWPNTRKSGGRISLAHAELEKALGTKGDGSPRFVMTRDEYQLSDIRCDLLEFRELARRKEFEKATELLVGEILESHRTTEWGAQAQDEIFGLVDLVYSEACHIDPANSDKYKKRAQRAAPYNFDDSLAPSFD